MSSPGPQSGKEALILFAKGICMGCADIIPGVSGGTMALITGIYDSLLAAIRSLNGAVFYRLITMDFKGAMVNMHLRFLAILLTGIGLAIIGLSGIMNFLLNNYEVQTWGFFFGLIFASLFVLGKHINDWVGAGAFGFISGTLAGYFLMGLIPVSTPETLWFVFLSGMIAICAMILPGISGAFILLILGKYTYITGVLKNPFTTHNFIIIIVFLGGCVLGILIFSRFLNYLLNNYHSPTLALLTGLMFGSLRKIWPWKETLETMATAEKVHVIGYRNILPPTYNVDFFITCLIMVIGFFLVMGIDKFTKSITFKSV